jgi:hypothetical protein
MRHLCKLCKKRDADKLNSHIIPKFLGKSLFQDTNPRHALWIDRGGSYKRSQDTPKEDNILCSFCERRFEIIETHFARIITLLHEYQKHPDLFRIGTIITQKYLTCTAIEPDLFKLFTYSIVWRCSISNLYEFKPFKLLEEHEEVLRSCLDSKLKGDHHAMLSSLQGKSEIPLYHYVIVKPEIKSAKSRGVFSAATMSDDAHVLFLVDLAIFFYTDNKSIGPVLRNFSNRQDRSVYITLGNLMDWRSLNEIYFSKLKNSNNSS